ncbi:transposase [Streptococcus pneumoniae]|uniref:Transposase n=1 Tax=Streptococcus pneumoniae TaxID=1313 RepID=A0AAJ5TK18_STREE|nr:transposase [Streptococcus pneumoniae SP9-BS68]EHE69930.1 transposase IS116/IS110/IS902 family protein [Streptococcus pneumoniae GA08780]EHZ78297.1 transposase IS116/IS110/IS902 family protein [Streptococcus pneumoniae GA49542]EJG50621.1 transposase IS116/IS110/IS902 family protein [Streptococcus pneumoniae 2070531]EJG51071.1 transposase IS116/IS110/IS902 family protein [Streptococcus pneumoniae 2070425]EJH07547.1 phosphoenolpyruvate synthase [Streptococcus pneumoniae GA56113]MCA1318112.1 
MESTSKYWIPVFNILEKSCKICLAHPKYVKAIRGKKTDKKDAQWIADLFKHDLVASSFIPPLKIRQLRDLFRYRMKLTQLQVSEKNRYQNCLTWSNLQIASVVSDVFGKSAQAIIQSILDNPEDKPNIEQLIHKRMKDKVQDLKIAIEGEVTPEQAEKIRIIKEHYDALAVCKEDLETMIRKLGHEYQEQVKLIQTVPGFKEELSALRILSEIGADMTVFGTAGKLYSWGGLVPANNESAGKKFSTRISKGGHYLKPFLVQIANAVVKSEKHPELRNKYLKLKKRRGHRKAIIAICRRLLVAIYHVFLKQESYNPRLQGLTEIRNPDKTMSVQDAIRFAQQRGFNML